VVNIHFEMCNIISDPSFPDHSATHAEARSQSLPSLATQ